MFCAIRILLSVGKVKLVGVNCVPERVSRGTLSAQDSRLAHSRLIDWSRGLASGSSLAKGVNTACSAHKIIRQRAIFPLQCLPKLKHAVPASS